MRTSLTSDPIALTIVGAGVIHPLDPARFGGLDSEAAIARVDAWVVSGDWAAAADVAVEASLDPATGRWHELATLSADGITAALDVRGYAAIRVRVKTAGTTGGSTIRATITTSTIGE